MKINDDYTKNTGNLKGFEYFLELVKNMKVGREILLIALPGILGEMILEAPEDYFLNCTIEYTVFGDYNISGFK